MPAITLRLSDEQHERVREWAFASRRSIQRELEARLFETLAERDQGTGEILSPLGGERDGSGSPTDGVSRSANVPKKPAAPPANASNVLGKRGTPKVCARAFAHHNYHAGKPCPHCGYPDTP